MREILFRGKRIDNGEWVYGFFSKSRDVNGKLEYCIDYEEKGVMCSSIVIPETVGQYTGLTDKNGTKIFEGDIAKDSLGAKFKVEWDDENARFIGRTIGNHDDTGYIVDKNQIVYVGREPRVEVIGNIHDNPELLDGVGNG